MASLLLDPSQFRVRIAQEIARSKRSGVTFTIVALTVVPEYGEHPAVACVRALPPLMDDVRDTDTLCRISDDCIAALLIDADAAGSVAAADRLVAGLRRHANRWSARIVHYPGNEDSLAELGLVA